MTLMKASVPKLESASVGDYAYQGQLIPKYQGLIAHTLPSSGQAVIQDANDALHTFRFDAISGYLGETARSLGLGVGTLIEYAELNNRVIYVKILEK